MNCDRAYCDSFMGGDGECGLQTKYRDECEHWKYLTAKKDAVAESPLQCGVMQPAIDRLKQRVIELKDCQVDYAKEGLMHHHRTAENTIQSLYIAIAILELTEAA